MQRRVSRSYGVLIEDQSIACRATFIVDQQGIIRHLLINDLAIRRSEQEILRILKAMHETDQS
jgi:alkyl hydroperoxide reductase subunit AhpC